MTRSITSSVNKRTAVTALASFVFLVCSLAIVQNAVAATSTYVSGSTLMVVGGGSDANEIVVTQGTNFTIDDAVAISAGTGCTLISTYQSSCSGSVTKVRVVAGSGDDTVDASQINVIADLNGGSGQDSLAGGTGNDQLQDDTGTPGTYSGSLGNDVFILTTTASTGAYVIGDGGDDTIYGSHGPDILYGSDGNDKVYGNGGDDQLSGLRGDDTVYGSTGNDVITEYRDLSAGDDGSDVLAGDGGTDTINYYTNSSEDITLSLDNVANDGVSGEGDNVRNNFEIIGDSNAFYSFEGDDTITGSSNADEIRSGLGNDTVYATDGVTDTIVCGSGTDTLDADTIDDYLFGSCESVTTH